MVVILVNHESCVLILIVCKHNVPVRIQHGLVATSMWTHSMVNKRIQQAQACPTRKPYDWVDADVRKVRAVIRDMGLAGFV